MKPWLASVLIFVALTHVGCDNKTSPQTSATKNKTASTDNNDQGVLFVGGDGVMNEAFIRLGGKAANGAYIITPYVNDVTLPSVRHFSEVYEKKFNKLPDAWAALSYDAVGMYAKVIEAVGPDREKIREALQAIDTPEKGFKGVTGITYFDANGDCQKPAIIARVQGGQFVKAKVQFANVKASEVWQAKNTGKPASGEPIYLGLAGAFTGTSAELGQSMALGARLRVEEVNAAGGVRGRRLALKRGDDEGSSSRAGNVAKQLALDSSIVAVVGHFNSNCSNAAKNIYKQNRVCMLSPGSTNVDVCKGNKYAFRNLYRDDFQGHLVAEFLAKQMQKKRVVVFHDADDYGQGLKNFFVDKAKELGLEVTSVIQYDRNAMADCSPLLTKAKYTNPDAIFVAGLYNEAALIAKAAREKALIK